MWIYSKNSDNSARFILGESGKRPLVCLGINPSTAEPDKLDNTLRSVRNYSLRKGYDGWIMFNVYPQRATKPSKLHQEMDKVIHKRNLKQIKKTISSYPNLTIWAAWGTLIRKRPFLKRCLSDIITALEPYPVNWVCRGNAKEHPHHPLYLRKSLPFRSFDIMKYLKFIG